ncbi:MAG: hypothetical protein ACJ74T_01655 [Pyrinomonadaceae bacterium]
MRRLTTSLISLLLAFTVGVTAATLRLARRAAPAPQTKVETPTPKREFALVIPRTTWEPIFFEPINKRTQTAKLSTLRAPLPEGALELRIWGGFGLSALEGFRIRRDGARWSASYFGTRFQQGRFEEYTRGLAQPKSGWEGAWDRLVSLGLLELPDAERAGCSGRLNDGYSYVVELNVERVYRTYMYDNPDASKCADAKRMLSIAAAVADEFGLEEFRPSAGPDRTR